MARLAIIGGGVAGCAAAWTLRDTSIEIVLFEKSRGVSGRAASRRRHGFVYDHGANYFKTDDPVVRKVILDALPTHALVEIGRDVWTYDGGGSITPGDAEQNAAPKWTYRSGIKTLGKLLFAQAHATARFRHHIERVERKQEGWEVVTAGGKRVDGFDAVLLTPPAPQTAQLLAASRFETRQKQRLVDALGAASYRAQFSFIFAFDRSIERPGDFYGLVNRDGAHDVAWLSFEDDKPGHVPQGKSLLVAQMAPGWTDARFEDPKEALADDILTAASALLGVTLPEPAWIDGQRWRYALPNARARPDMLAEGRALGLFFAGDALVGKGRVPLALKTGLSAARSIRNFFEILY